MKKFGNILPRKKGYGTKYAKTGLLYDTYMALSELESKYPSGSTRKSLDESFLYYGGLSGYLSSLESLFLLTNSKF